MAERACINCGLIFMPKAHNSLNCSERCQTESHRRKWRENRAKNLEYHRHRVKLWKSENKDKVSSYNKKYVRPNKEKDAVTKKIYYSSNKDKVLDRVAKWVKENPEKHARARVRMKLKSELGITPPQELVEEATAIRLLNRAIRKAGE